MACDPVSQPDLRF